MPPSRTASLAILVHKRSPFPEISKSQKSERDTARVLSRPHSPVPQTMYWSQTESSKWSLNYRTAPPAPPPYCTNDTNTKHTHAGARHAWIITRGVATVNPWYCCIGTGALPGPLSFGASNPTFTYRDAHGCWSTARWPSVTRGRAAASAGRRSQATLTTSGREDRTR